MFVTGRAIAVLVGASLFLGGCATDTPPVAGPPVADHGHQAHSATTAPATPTPTAVLAGINRNKADHNPNLSPESQRPSEPAQLAVSQVWVDTHDGDSGVVDRIEVQLEGDGEPGWFVDYTSTPMKVSVGKPLTMDGQEFLNINVDGTIHPGEIGVDITELIQVANPSDNVVAVVNGGTSEGRSQIVVGLRDKAPYSVQMLDNPKRLIIDLQR
ncbi:AMIN-like domain-containing (lipo)protein [Corynebacterium riegelii]|uniref:AMIN-like domain-containing (lipo)protein n=1 Tax=Corynebacterium riegelii TaxID=156976 RepID=UPI0023F863D6|nr:hypothetical protein [Corynebacterium riegelii]